MGRRHDHVEWSPEEDAFILATIPMTGYDVAVRINEQFHGGKGVRSQAAVGKRRWELGIRKSSPKNATPLQPKQPKPEPPPKPDPITAERERQERVKSLREEREALQAVAGEKSLRSALEAVVSRVVTRFDAPPKYVAPKSVKGKKPSVETAIQMFSDWHAGENVSAEAVRGFNEFNDRIFRERVDRVVEAHLSIKDRLESGGGYRFEKCIVGANGDFVSGTIHELEKHSDHDNIVWAVYETGRILANAVRQYAAQYPTVEVFCTSGNHGRLPDARRVQQKEPTRSWDTLVYLFAKEMLADCRNVSFFIPNSYSAAFDVYGWRFLQTHGHDVKSWNSIPWYGLNRLVGNINALEAGRGTPIHYWLFAHFHNASSLPHASGESFVNGSIIGSNEFAFNALGKADRPTQWLLQVHPEHGVGGRWPLFADAPIASPRRG